MIKVVPTKGCNRANSVVSADAYFLGLGLLVNALRLEPSKTKPLIEEMMRIAKFTVEEVDE